MTRLLKRSGIGGEARLAHWVALGASTALLDITPALADATVEFQSGFLRQHPEYTRDAGALALSALGQSQDLGPGRYRVELQINRRSFGLRELDFSLSPEGDLLPCLSSDLLQELGVRLDGLADNQALNTDCIDLASVIPGANIEFEGAKLWLSLSVPQIAMRRNQSGYADPERWDHGINAAFINYQVSAQQSNHQQGGSSQSDDLYLNSGLNLGAWRLRSNQTLRRNEQNQREWSSAYTYAQRDLPGLQANLTLGETFTRGDVFRSLPIKGAIIASDPDMLPDALQGYAPVIRGVAQTRAKLEVLQNGYPIYSTYVSPGAYEIDDLTTVGGSGELEIVLTEADGQVHRYTQPYATLSNLLREGLWRYSATVGHYNAISEGDHPLLWQGTLAWGLGWSTTLYGGAMGSDFYRAVTLGASRDLGALGALALDLSHSDTQASQDVQGKSYSVKYGKSFQSGTQLRFAGYRYSTEGYRDFDEAVRDREHDVRFFGSRRSRLEAAINQKIGKHSSVNLTFSHQDYWQTNNTQRQFQFNFNTQHKGVTYNVYALQSLRDNDKRNMSEQRQMGLSVSLPLDFMPSSTATFDVQNNAGRHSQRASLSGNSLENRLNYRTSISHDSQQRQSAELALGYQGATGSVGAGITQSSHYRTTSLNASGALLLHADGIEAGPYLGETLALVEVPDIPGVGVKNATGVKTNAQGFALVPYLRPYRMNQVSLQTDDLGPEIEIDNGTAQVVPRRGAVVKTTFTARTINRLLISGQTANGQALPFGAQVSDAQGTVLGTVGQAGQVLLSVGPEPQQLNVRWAPGDAPQCRLDVNPQTMEQVQGYRIQALTCH
ncbi:MULTISPECIES: fimbria/pilus outer membrane usher protein [unclassified Pseudomonas]|uniref:fimbria/pilus outer membrane usher protein n=1 Tax=unclassified Pseudomonas TaxID=196821 RepID=UPI00089AEABB|nr:MULTISPECIES: fimbria/pilus outer membrane usher protein [unclassified Pseudomonas]SDY64050.1 outer membrane usher protein [Pseudomonas sp. NFACC08-1]SEJ81354.1 outer membrane usher protein [Pseudomonas sp. NFACC07-1]